MTRRFLLCLFCLMLLTTGAWAEHTVITLTCAGDTTLGCNEKVRQQDYAYDRYIEKYGYGYPMAELQSLFAYDDITLVNLEGVLSDTVSETAAKSRFIFRGPTEYARILSQGSVEVVNLANNHSMDYGKEGYLSTVAALEREGVAYCGSTTGGSYTWIYEQGDIKIGFAGVLPAYRVESAKCEQDLIDKFQQLKDAGCQLIVASLHCGKENIPLHDSIHDRYERICMKYGAQLIIGTHPHVPQGINVTDGVTHLYSLGNFTFGGNTGVDEKMTTIQSYVAQFQLHFEDGRYVGHQLTIWPIHISGTAECNNYQPVLVEGEEAQKVMRMIQKDTRFKLNPYVDGQGAVQEFVPWEE